MAFRNLCNYRCMLVGMVAVYIYIYIYRYINGFGLVPIFFDRSIQYTIFFVIKTTIYIYIIYIYRYLSYIHIQENTHTILWTRHGRLEDFKKTHHGYARFINDKESGCRFNDQGKKMDKHVSAGVNGSRKGCLSFILTKLLIKMLWLWRWNKLFVLMVYLGKATKHVYFLSLWEEDGKLRIAAHAHLYTSRYIGAVRS